MKIKLEQGLYLKKKYGTPLYVYNVNYMKNIMNTYIKYFKSEVFSTEVAFASKAFCVKEMIRLVSSCNLSLDCVSMGELYTAKSVNFDMSRIYFHWNFITTMDIT